MSEPRRRGHPVDQFGPPVSDTDVKQGQVIGDVAGEAAIESIVVTDTCSMPSAKRLDKITQLTVAPLFAKAIERIHTGESVGALFE